MPPPLILASASPRRRDLLRELGIDFDVIPAPLDEPTGRPADLDPAGWAESLAHYKAYAVAQRHPDRTILGADTIVVVAGEVLGKPRDEADARRMLTRQAGVPSLVITGVCLLRRGAAARRLITHDVTRVWMRDDPEQRETYLRSGDWQGKAGGYGIQTVGDRLVARIEGSFSNVVGLPIERLSDLLRQFG